MLWWTVEIVDFYALSFMHFWMSKKVNVLSCDLSIDARI